MEEIEPKERVFQLTAADVERALIEYAGKAKRGLGIARVGILPDGEGDPVRVFQVMKSAIVTFKIKADEPEPATTPR